MESMGRGTETRYRTLSQDDILLEIQWNPSNPGPCMSIGVSIFRRLPVFSGRHSNVYLCC